MILKFLYFIVNSLINSFVNFKYACLSYMGTYNDKIYEFFFFHRDFIVTLFNSSS